MRFWKSTTTIVLLLTTSGCVGTARSPSSLQSAYHGPEGRQTFQADPARLAVAAFEPDVSGLDNFTVREDVTPHTVVEEGELQCWAAMNSVPARLLLSEGRAIVAQASRRQMNQAKGLNEVLELQSVHERNKSAALALQGLLRLVEAEAGIINLDRSQAELAKMIEDLQRLRELQISAPVSSLQLQERQLKLQHRREEARVATGRINKDIGELLGLENHALPRIWPEIDLVVTPTVEDVDLAIHVALTTRADLAASYRANYHAANGTLDARQILGLQPGLGIALSGKSHLSWLHPSRDDDEDDARSRQLQDMTADLERTIAQEVSLAVATIERRLQQIRQTKERLNLLQQRLDGLEKLRATGKATPFEPSETRLEVVTTENDLLHDVIEWKIAVVQLKEAQGLLAQECGYDAAMSTCDPCW